MASEFELHKDRLSTSDEKGRRIFLHPADVKGFFRGWRTRSQAVLILFFLLLPWVKIGGQQALLLNITDRRFEIFGLSLRAHNSPLLILVLTTAIFGLFFITAVWGRIWCGWACPQTVFIDGVFRRIERWIEGGSLERKKLDAAPWTPRKVFKRTAKWSLYLLVSLVLTHSFLAYFVGTEKLRTMISSSPYENWGNFLFIVIATAVILFDFAWFREQFCTIVCPYGRFQSVIMDRRSLVVAYDVARGEPRATAQTKALAKAHGGKLGDCVNCYRCVQVCPTGIDIRRGVQMECIACTSCIDACDDVMTKLKKPTGLIKYDSVKPTKTKRPNARAISYFILCAASVLALAWSVARLKPVSFEILRAKGAPYTLQTNIENQIMIVNHLKLELSNQSDFKREMIFKVAMPDGMQTGRAIELVTAMQPFSLPGNSVRQVDVFLRFPKTMLQNGLLKTQITVGDATQASLMLKREVTLVGPFN